MVAKNLSVNVIGCPIHRESNNLAMSSRNERSSRRKSRSGSHLQNTSRSKEKFATNSISAVSRMAKRFKTILTLEYFTIADEETLLSSTRKIK
jgi:pantoate--beta-alanine ligase